MQCSTADARIVDMYRWFRSAMTCVGARPAELKCRDWTKSYTYRALVKFAERVDKEFKFNDDRSIKIFMILAARYAKTKGLLAKGAHILTISSVNEYVCSELERVRNVYDSVLEDIKRSHGVLLGLTHDVDEPISVLSKPLGLDGFPLIVHQHKLGAISTSYLSVSRLCRRALAKLDYVDRSEVPTNLDLELARIRITTDPDLRRKVRAILKTDFISD